MNRLERALWEALDVAIDRANEAEAELREWNKGGRDPGVVEQVWANCPDELANLRADLEAVCRERDAALEREGELQRRIHNLQVAADGYRTELRELDKLRTEAKNLRANCDLFQRERDDFKTRLHEVLERDEAIKWEMRHKLLTSIQSRPMDSTPNTC